VKQFQLKAKHPGGRFRVTVGPEHVKQLRDGGLSWRRTARRLGIGTATAMRLYNARFHASEASQNSE
jgi:transposase-like protein